MSEPLTVRDALLLVAENVAKHTIQRDGWSADDTCFLVDLTAAEVAIEAIIVRAAADALQRGYTQGVRAGHGPATSRPPRSGG